MGVSAGGVSSVPVSMEVVVCVSRAPPSLAWTSYGWSDPPEETSAGSGNGGARSVSFFGTVSVSLLPYPSGRTLATMSTSTLPSTLLRHMSSLLSATTPSSTMETILCADGVDGYMESP